MTKKRRILLIDDDAVYGAVVKSLAPSLGVEIDCHTSLAEMHSIGQMGKYDFVILDYHLKSWKGTEIAAYLDAFFPQTPAAIVSADESLVRAENWSQSIRLVLPKSLGPEAIIKNVIAICDREDTVKSWEKTPGGPSKPPSAPPSASDPRIPSREL